MAGTFATFAGIPCLDVQFARSRGWESDVTVVEVPAGPAATLEKPKTLSARPLPTQTRPPAGPLGPVQVPAFIPHEGSLYLAEVSHGDERWDVTIGPLFVARCEAVKTPDGSQVVRYRLSLVDERYFWPRGLMPRWSFNRRRGDGTIAADSLKPDGSPFSRREVADEAVRALFRRPQLAHAPVEWQSDRREHSFEPFAPAVAVLSTMANEDGLEAPCLRMDNTVAFYRAGEGKVGFAPGGQGANAEDFPPHVKVYKGGSGQGHVAENGYPEDYALVVGGVRIASVAWRGMPR